MGDMPEIVIPDASIPPRIRDQGYERIREWVKREIDKTYGMVMPQCTMRHDRQLKGHVIRGPLKAAPLPCVEPARDATPTEDLGVQFRQVRKARGLTQKQAGAALGGLIQADVSSLERGRGSQQHLLLAQAWIDDPTFVQSEAGADGVRQDFTDLIVPNCDFLESSEEWRIAKESPTVTFLGL